MTKFEKEFLQELREIKQALVALRQPQYTFVPSIQFPPYVPPGTTWISSGGTMQNAQNS
jgi:hypothetical protein